MIREAAAPFGFNPDSCYAVARTESGLVGFGKTGKIIIQFEPHVFRRNLPADALKVYKHVIGKANKGTTLTAAEKILLDLYTIINRNGVEDQVPEWHAFNAAFKVDQEAAIKGASWGAFQILGENHVAAGFKTVREMHAAYITGEAAQVASFLRFCNAHPTPRSVLRLKAPGLEAFAKFARYYNGPAYLKFAYHKKMLQHYTDATK